jgi:hypothetical protein
MQAFSMETSQWREKKAGNRSGKNLLSKHATLNRLGGAALSTDYRLCTGYAMKRRANTKSDKVVLPSYTAEQW